MYINLLSSPSQVLACIFAWNPLVWVLKVRMEIVVEVLKVRVEIVVVSWLEVPAATATAHLPY